MLSLRSELIKYTRMYIPLSPNKTTEHVPGDNEEPIYLERREKSSNVGERQWEVHIHVLISDGKEELGFLIKEIVCHR